VADGVIRCTAHGQRSIVVRRLSPCEPNPRSQRVAVRGTLPAL